MRLVWTAACVSIASAAVASCIMPQANEGSRSGMQPLKQDELARYAVIPWPRKLTPRPGQFVSNEETRVVCATDDPRVQRVAAYLGEVSGLPLADAGALPTASTVLLRLDPAIREPEGYRLSVGVEKVEIAAGSAQGLFYGVQTLRQWLPLEAERAVGWQLPAVDIEDGPRFAYRGMHLDVGRHFFPVAFIKRYIDQLARFKMNTFHWHLTEDQGWRIEIKRYPKLTEVGAYRKETLVGHGHASPREYDGVRYGGFYTQEEIREVVRYAEERFVTIVPEIEMPGHALAVLAAYPELGCTEGPFEVATRWGVFEDILCPREETFTFLQNVLSEVIELFPGKYVHIGGDEAPKVRWQNSELVQRLKAQHGLKDEAEVQSYFIRRIDSFLTSRGKTLIGWDEILEGGLSDSAVVMSWRGVSGGVEAAKQGHAVVMTPTSHCYFDFYQGPPDAEPLAIGGYLPLEQVYEYEPVPEQLTPEEASLVLGAQGNVWTEYMKTTDHVEYMVFPRLLALSEVVWSAADAKNYESFLVRLRPNVARLEQLGLHVARHGL